MQFEDQKLTILEAGCGVGNCLFPLLEEDLNIFAYACDFSPRAVEYVKVGEILVSSFCRQEMGAWSIKKNMPFNWLML